MILKDFIGIIGDKVKLTTKITSIKKDIAKNGRAFYRVGLGDGTVAFAWDWAHIKNAKLGQEADLEIEKKGNFLYIKNASSVLTDETEPTEIESEDPGPGEEDEIREDVRHGETGIEEGKKKIEELRKTVKVTMDGKDLAITRMSCLKTAVEYMQACGSTDLIENDIIEIAQRFEDYVKNGK
jgi:hypothetical protein